MVHAQSECGLAPAQFEEEGDLARGRERQLTTTRAAKKKLETRSGTSPRCVSYVK